MMLCKTTLGGLVIVYRCFYVLVMWLRNESAVKLSLMKTCDNIDKSEVITHL